MDIEDVLVSSQQYFVYQLAHKHTSIKSDDEKPWIRCIGFTSSLDGARTLAKEAFEYGNKTETRIMPVGKVFLAGCFKYDGLDLPRREEEQIKAVNLYNGWVKEREELSKQFQKHKSLENQSSEEKIQSLENHPSEKNQSTNRPPTPIPLEPVAWSTITYGKQTVWACGIVPDTSELNEPCLIPLFASETTEALEDLVKEAAKCKDLYHVDIFVGTVGEWLPLNNPRAGKKFHHHPLLQEAYDQLNGKNDYDENANEKKDTKNSNV